MLFRRDVLDGIVAGKVSLAFRRWEKPRVKAGSQLRTAIGVVEVTAIALADEAAISEQDARNAGAATRADLLDALRGRGGDLYRVELRHAGEDGRIALRAKSAMSKDDYAAIASKLARFDAASRHGAWTHKVLTLIAAHPATRAAELAVAMKRETKLFKADVRKLKELGLTESLDVGYRLSPRGRAVIARLKD